MYSLSEFLLSAWSGVVGNALFLGALAIVGYLLRYLPNRRALRRFFQKRKGQPLYIILSNIKVAQGGGVGVGGVTYSFANSAIPTLEAQAAQRFRGALLSPIPGLAGQPGLLSAIFVSEFSVEVSPSPMSAATVPNDGTVISVGGPAYNVMSAMIEQKMFPPAQCVGVGITFLSGKGSSDPAVGFICRILDSANDRYIFYVAGPSEEATAASLSYLLSSWKDLERRYRGKSSFSLAVRFLAASPMRSKVEFYNS